MKNINSIKTLNKNQLQSTIGGSSSHGDRGSGGRKELDPPLLIDLYDIGITYSSHGIGGGTRE